MRRCLGCNALIAAGSRCKACQERYRNTYSRHEWAGLVKARAGYRCQQCGSHQRVVADHIVPLSQGGDNSLGNGQCLCQVCHREKHGGQAAKAS